MLSTYVRYQHKPTNAISKYDLEQLSNLKGRSYHTHTHAHLNLASLSSHFRSLCMKWKHNKTVDDIRIKVQKRKNREVWKVKQFFWAKVIECSFLLHQLGKIQAIFSVKMKNETEVELDFCALWLSIYTQKINFFHVWLSLVLPKSEKRLSQKLVCRNKVSKYWTLLFLERAWNKLNARKLNKSQLSIQTVYRVFYVKWRQFQLRNSQQRQISAHFIYTLGCDSAQIERSWHRGGAPRFCRCRLTWQSHQSQTHSVAEMCRSLQFEERYSYDVDMSNTAWIEQ